jgi:hypothetical protein
LCCGQRDWQRSCCLRLAGVVMTVTLGGAGPVRGIRRLAWMRRRGVVVALAAAVVLVCAWLLAGTGLAPAAASVRAAALRVHWGRAVEVPGLGALNAGGNARVLSVSCWRAGDCAAGGFYTDSGGRQQAFVVNESNGVWGTAEEVPGAAALNTGGIAQVLSLACTPHGYCAAGGYYNDSKENQQAFVVSETGGRWGTAREVPGTGKLNVGGQAQVDSVSCASAGDCAAGGYYQTPLQQGVPRGQDSQAFVVSERHGRWSKAEEVPGMAALSPPPFQVNYVDSMSCRSAGNCTAGGAWHAGPNGGTGGVGSGGFVLGEVDGRWHRLVLPRNGGGVGSVSCWRAGDCVAAGENFVETETNGRWGTARRFPATTAPFSSDGGIRSVSCPSAGYCTAAGFLGYDLSDQAPPDGGFVISQRHGRWGKVQDLAGLAGSGSLIGSLSCASAGNCGAGGSYADGTDQYANLLYGGLVVGERNGRWAAAEVPPGLAALNLGGNSQVNQVSCPSASNCVVGGFYTDAAGHTQAFVDGSR